MHKLYAFVLASTVFAVPAFAEQKTYSSKANDARKLSWQVDAITSSKLGGAAIWRHNGFRTPEVVSAMKDIRVYLTTRAAQEKTPDLVVDVGVGKLFVTPKGTLREIVAANLLFHPSAEAVEGKTGTEITDAILTTAARIKRGEAVPTARAHDLVVKNKLTY